jgi:hypothetical protein
VSLVLFAIRTISAISFAEPLFVITSGAEEESTFAIWKYVHGLAVYADPYLPPFAASYYNWLFYAVYGTTTAFARHVFGLGDEWIPTIGRLPTLIFTGLGAIIAYYLFRPGFVAFGTNGQILAAALASFAFMGPLIGFWAISVNPEIAATVLGFTAISIFLAWYQRWPLTAVVAASILSYLSWSFKQSHVFVAGALMVFLFFRRDWRSLGFVVAIHGLTVGGTLAAGTDAYRLMIFYHIPLAKELFGAHASGLNFEIATLTRNLINLAVKAGPLAAICILPFILARMSPGGLRRAFNDDRLLLALCGFVISTILAIPASAKIGAAENYYFPLSIFTAFALATLWPHTAFYPQVSRAFFAIFAAGWIANAVACATVLTGKAGVLSVRSWHAKFIAQRACIAATPGPRLLIPIHLAVPWINPSGPYFVYAYNYPYDRAAGYQYPEGTIHDLIARAYFATLVVSEGSPAEFDGASFERYTPASTSCAGLSIYSRMDAKPTG